MFFLLLAVISNALLMIILRFYEEKPGNNMIMFLANYIVCVLVSAVIGFRDGLPAALTTARGAQIGFALLVGLISGCFFLSGFLVSQKSIRENGVVLSALFSKLGVLVPTLMAVLIYHDQPGTCAVIGFALALAAIFVINSDGIGAVSADISENITGQIAAGTAANSSGGSTAASAVLPGRGRKLLLISVLLVGGFTDSMTNIFDKGGAAELKDLFLLITFLTAGVLSAVVSLIRGQHFTKRDFCWGIVLGIPNYFASFFFLLALKSVPAVIAYPVNSAGALLAVSTAGVLIFREKIDRRKRIGLILILAALILLNLQSAS